VVAQGLGLVLPMRAAVAAYYRSQFLNSTLPGGVLGDVHRAARQGRLAGNLGRSVQAVTWERGVGQVVQLVVTLVVVLTLPSPAGLAMPLVGATAVAAAVGTILMGRSLRRRRRDRRALTACGVTDPRPGGFAWSAAPGIVLASGLVVLGHTATFLIAARAAGSVASPIRLLPLALVVQVASAIPVNFAGWGPREGAAAWVFGAAGLGTGEGLGVSVVYGMLVLVATLPGAVLLLASGLRGSPQAADPT
jgi:glycosyltransferase 2 family protein